ncbi:hypothetical protein [Serratia quinivorans]|uniref:hypothetical protein n=1 Tax=Serratia quinivorans TaxID=137545 RepID=UPI003F996AED
MARFFILYTREVCFHGAFETDNYWLLFTFIFFRFYEGRLLINDEGKNENIWCPGVFSHYETSFCHCQCIAVEQENRIAAKLLAIDHRLQSLNDISRFVAWNFLRQGSAGNKKPDSLEPKKAGLTGSTKWGHQRKAVALIQTTPGKESSHRG